MALTVVLELPTVPFSYTQSKRQEKVTVHGCGSVSRNSRVDLLYTQFSGSVKALYAYGRTRVHPKLRYSQGTGKDQIYNAENATSTIGSP